MSTELYTQLVPVLALLFGFLLGIGFGASR